MSTQTEINPKKLILSTTEVSKLLLSKGRRKINESILSHGGKTLNNVDLTDLTSQINLKLSKETDNNMTMVGDQSMFRPFGEKSMLYNKQRNFLDRSGFYGFERFNQRDSNANSNNILSKIDKSQLGGEGGDNQDKNKKKLLKLDSTEIIFDKNNSMKISSIINNYFPYECDNNLESSTKLKNFLVIFYFIIEKSTYVLIKKLDKNLSPLYFWNREEDAKKFGINYSQVNTPGLYFKNYENFKETFKYHGFNFIQTINKLKNILIEKKKEYEQNIENMKNEYEMKIKELEENNELLKEKVDEYENDNNLKNLKIQELTDKLNDTNEEIDELKLINEKLKSKIKKLKKNKDNNKENINNNQKSEEKNKKGNNKVLKTFFKSKTKMDINPNKNLKMKQNKYLSGRISEYNKYYYENHNSETKYENDDVSITEQENSFPKLEDYNIENDEDEKINKIRTISNIKTYGERKRYYQNFNSVNNNTPKNNVFITIKDSSDKNGKNFTETYKNKYQSETIEYNNDTKRNNNSSNKFNSQEDSSNY